MGRVPLEPKDSGMNRNSSLLMVLLPGLTLLGACVQLPSPPPLTAEDRLIAKGREIFFNERFGGNGRTCRTCHPAHNNLTLDPAFVATLPAGDPLFVAETNPKLSQHFENPRLMRGASLILEN